MIFGSMKCSALLILVLNTFSVSSEVRHEAVVTIGCFHEGTPEVQLAFDDEEIFYVDYERQEVEFTVPEFFVKDPKEIFEDPHTIREALKINKTCPTALSFWNEVEKHPPEELEPPNTFLYPAADVKLGVENSLICYINHFYPPNITVRWTKNGHPVSEGISLSRYYPNKDHTFHQFSTLNFTPNEVDMYSCIVEHAGLERSTTKIWEPELPEYSQGPDTSDVFLGISVTLGLLSAAAGMILFVKGHNRR